MNVLKNEKISQTKEFRFAGILLFLVLFAEIFLFNFRYWESRFNREITDYSFTTGEGIVNQGNGTFLLTEGDKYLEFSQIDRKLHTLYIDIEILDGNNDGPIMLYQSARDESHELYYRIPDRQIWHSQEKSKYLTYHLYGECKSIRITPTLNNDVQIRVRYQLNAVTPMFFSWRRMGVLWLVIFIIYLLRPSSFVHKIVFLDMKRGKSIALTAFLMVHLIFFGLLVHINPFFQTEGPVNQQEYRRLAESLSQGKAHILEEPAPSLIEMENPYDYDMRYQVLGNAGESFLWDYAYFDGKYYVYFGIVPVVLFYLPYYLLTGEHLYNYQVIFIGAVFMLVGIMGIIYQIIKRYFPRTSLGIWYLLTELVVTGSGLIYMCKRPDMYTVPILTGLGLGLLGIWCFLCAEKEGRLSPVLVAVGSLCMALVAGCRPQLFLMVLIPVLALKEYIFSFTYLRTREGIRSAAAFVFPMIVVAAFLMYYNSIRFGSIFDFGANYNLTFNDMRNRGFVFDRLPLGIFAYLFAPLKMTFNFPFAEANYFQTNYLGVTIAEATYGGIFAVNLFLWMGPLFLLLHKRYTKNMVTAGIMLCLVVGLVIVMVDTEMSGILMRYFSDFNIFFLFAALLSWFLFYQETKTESVRNYLIMFLIICLILSVIYQGRIFFLDTGEALADLRKDLFAQIKYQVMFWL